MSEINGVKLEPSQEEQDRFKAKVEGIMTLKGLALAQAFADNAHEAAENELLREVLVYRIAQVIGEGDTEVTRFIKEGSREAKAATKLLLAPTDGKAH